MQETLELKISDRDKTLADGSGQVWEKLLALHEKNLDIFLSYYYRPQGAIVENVKLLTPLEFKEKQKGTFKVKFDVVYFNACLNIHEEEKGEMELDFIYDPLQSKVVIIGPDWPEREADEI